MDIPIVKRLWSISRASCIALTLSLFVPGLLYAAPSTQIFVLHSYSQEYLWTRGQHEGFIQALAEDAQVDANVSTEYLDTKRRAYDEAYAIELARHLRIKYKGYKPAAIYVTDDNALLFARDHLSRIFPGTPVFFSGVNDYSVLSSLDLALFTGVFERKEVVPNLEWLIRLDKDANDLVFIGDGSNTDRAIETEARLDIIPYRLRATFIAEKRLDRALERLRDLPGKYLFLTTLGGMTDANGQVLPLCDILKSLALVGRIVVSMEDAYIIEGVLGGHVTSGQKQGMNAARLLLSYRHGKPILDLPPILKSPNALIFDDRVLQQYGIHLPESLRAQAILLNPRLGFYEQYQSLIMGGVIGLAALLFLVVTGSLVIVTRKNRDLGLARNNAESANTLFNQLAEQSRTVHWEVNAAGLYTYVSPVSSTVLGYRPEELVDQKHFYDLLTEEERDTNRTTALEFFAQKEPFHNLENTARTKDGRLIWILTNGIPVLDDHGTFLGYRGSYSDISERKVAEQALIESEKRLHLVTDHVPALIGYVDNNYKYQFVNKNYEKWFCLKQADMLGMNIKELLPRGTYELCLPYINRALAGEEVTFEGNIVLPNGAHKVSYNHLVPDRSSNDEIMGYYVLISDITERKRAEEVLRDRESKLSSIFRAAPVGIGMVINRVFREANDTLCQMTGYSREEILDQNARMLYPTQEDYDYVGLEKYRQLDDQITGTVETRWKRKDGTIIDIILSSTPIDPDNRAIGITFTALDITERKQAEEERRVLEERLQHTDKMEAIGTLAGGIAHDFNNLLMGIQGYASLTLMNLDSSHPNYERLKRIEEHVQSGADLTRQLLGFARGGRYDVKPADMNDILEKSSSMFGRTKKEITIHRKYGKGLWPVEVDRGQMEQVFMNLYVNAWQAMPGGGEIYLETEDVLLDDAQTAPYAVRPGKYVKITVTDTGTGMDEKTKARIFDPFFTTKAMGRGTGLGLATVYGIIKGHKGVIHVDSEPAHGTTFTIYLPASEKEVVEEKTATGTIARGTETILLVDDEKMVLEVSKEMLEFLGYRVYAAGSGHEALAVCMEKRNEIDLVILDMVMPGISGGETFNRLREINPDTKVLLSSGYSIDGEAKTIMDRGCNGFIQKPFQLEKLSGQVRDILG